MWQHLVKFDLIADEKPITFHEVKMFGKIRSNGKFVVFEKHVIQQKLTIFQRFFLVSFGLFCLFSFVFAQKISPDVFTKETRSEETIQETKSSSEDKSSIRFLEKIESREEFDSIANTLYRNMSYPLPYVMFAIDRKNGNKIYFINSKRYRFHKDFLLANYLIPRGVDLHKLLYIDENRRFIIGTIALQFLEAPKTQDAETKDLRKFTWELWEGDMATSEHIKLAHQIINQNFFQEVYFKPNSTRQEEISEKFGIKRILQGEIIRNQEFMALNPGKTIGRVHVIEKLDDTVEIGSNEIVILKELPLSLPPVRGIIVAKPSTPLSHVNILAKGWGIPNAYIKNADKLFAEYHSWWAEFEVTMEGYKLKRLVDYDPQERPEIPAEEAEQVPPVNLQVRKIAGLKQIRKKDSIAYGSKAANLGEMLFHQPTDFKIPDGFVIPFYWYDKFMKDNGLDSVVEELIDDYDFVHNPRIRRQKLAELREKIQKGKFDPKLQAEVIRRWRTQLRGLPVFVRSSSNTEDLPNFSGAGLYSTARNVRTAQRLIEGIKYVWASLWNFEAYEARLRNYVSQTGVYMSALVQIGINMDKGGVMITKDPFDDENKGAVFISVVCGHNSLIPDNKGIPEQILYSELSDSIVVKTLSQQENALTFSRKDDLVETRDRCARINGRILSDNEIRRLVKIAKKIEQIFGGEKAQDIEWGMMKGVVYIVQSRPYIEK